jgi:hypothetical protein
MGRLDTSLKLLIATTVLIHIRSKQFSTDRTCGRILNKVTEERLLKLIPQCKPKEQNLEDATGM